MIDKDVEAPEQGAKPKFKRDNRGKIVSNSQLNIKTALDHLGTELSYDLLKDRPLLDGEPLADHGLNALWLTIDLTYKFRPSFEFFTKVVLTLARVNSFHPVLDYLNGLEWDGKARLDTWLIDHFNAPDTEYVKAVSPIVLMAAVRRLDDPGCKFDELPILESQQGDGKSTGIGHLAIKDEWYTDALTLNASPKVVIEQTHGFWIIECPDLQGFKHADWNKLKAHLSRRVDTARLSYDRLTSYKPRQFVAIGTTNGEKYLSDPTGNRRFWPIRLKDGEIDQVALIAARDQLWAEAVVRSRRGDSIRLSKELWATAQVEQDARMYEDEIYNLLHAALAEHEEGRILTDSLWVIIGITDMAKRSNVMGAKIRGAMTRLGWTAGKNDGRIMVRGKYRPGWTKGERPPGTPLPLLVHCVTQDRDTFLDGVAVQVATPDLKTVDPVEGTVDPQVAENG